MHVDVDDFSALNARLGRPLADRVLRAVARRLLHCVRQGDTAARLEADAFVLVLPGLHHGEDATRIAEKVLRALRKPFPLTDGAVPLTASVGIAVFPEDGEDAPALLASAEQSSRRAHEAGGDRLESSAPPPLDDGYDALELEAGLRAALAGGSMALNGSPRPRASSTTSRSTPSARQDRGRRGAPALAAPADGPRLPPELPLEVRLHGAHPRHRAVDPPHGGGAGARVAAEPARRCGWPSTSRRPSS